jgi:membrane protease YdiL (CAAX protease family)
MKRLEWIIGALLAVFLILGVSVALIVFTNNPAEEVAASADLTALSAYNLALPAVREWAADAAVVNVRASWQEGTDFTSGQASWGFVFYSPGQAATVSVAVTDDQAILLNSQKLDQAPPLITAGAWNINSETAAQLLLNSGGSGFIHTQGGAALTMMLSAADGQTVWEGTFMARETRRTLYIRLDAGSGAVLDVQQSD